MSKTKIPSLIEFLFLAPVILNRMVRVSFVEQRDEDDEGKDTWGERVFRRRAQLVKRFLAHCRHP